MAADKTTTAVALTDDQRYLMVSNPNLIEALRENLGPNGSADKLDLPRLRVPAGGGLAWTVPTIEGPKPREYVEGVIISWSPVRAYWPQAIGDGGGNAPPDCSSSDGQIGIGTPGGACETCSFNQFGSKDAGGGTSNAKACREARGMLVLPQGELMPFYLPAPTMSIKTIKDYFMRLTSQGKPYHAVVTRFNLGQAQNKGGIVYSQIEPQWVRDLEDDERTALRAYRDAVVPAFTAAPRLTQSDFVGA